MKIVEGKKPVIAKVHGAAYAAGCQLAASCDLAYSTTTATFATEEVWGIKLKKLSYLRKYKKFLPPKLELK